jgi:HK97 family phage portal protein
MAGPLEARSGDIISIDNPKAGAMIMSQDFASFDPGRTSPQATFANYDAARTVATFIANAIAVVPFDVYRRDSDGARTKLHEEDHLVAATLEAPTPGLGFARWAQALMLDFRIHDRWCALKVYEDDGSLSLVRIPAQNVRFVRDDTLVVTHVVLVRGGKTSGNIPISNFVYDVGYDPFGSRKGSGLPISGTMQTATTELEQGARYRAALLAGGPKVPMYIKRPADAPEWVGARVKGIGRTKFLEEFKEFSGERAGQVPILEDGMELAAAPQLPVADVKYSEARLAAQIEYAIANGVPPELLGYRAGNFSNMEALREQLYTLTLQFDIVAFRQALMACLRDELGRGIYIEENIAARLASTPEKQAIVLQTQVGAPIRTRNEARLMQNLPPVDGGDELITPLNVTLGGLASPRDTGPKAAGTASPYELALEHLEHQAKAAGGKPDAGALAAAPTALDQFSAAFKLFMFGQRKDVLAALGTGSSPGSLDGAFDLEAQNLALADVFYRHSYNFAKMGAEAINGLYAPDTPFDYERMLPWLQKASIGTARAINQSTFAALAVEIFGDDWQLKAAAVFDDQAAKSDTVAKTSATAAKSFGQMDAAKSAGLWGKKWVGSGSPQSRHGKVSGEVVPIGEVFTNGGRYPGDPLLEPDDRIGCECSLVFVRDKPDA